MQNFEETNGFKVIETPETFIGLALNIVNIEDEDLKFTAKKRLKKIKNEFSDTINGRKLDELRITLFNLVQKMVVNLF